MKGDFSRMTFSPDKHFSRVLMQQGRVQLDADWNEQVSILLHYVQTLAADLIGPHGGPGDGFKIGRTVDDFTMSDDDWKALGQLRNNDFVIGKGHYYVNGRLCENESYTLFSDQSAYSPPALPDDGTHLVYLDAWERHVTYVEDEDADKPGIREVALRGTDTATRAELVWQVRTWELTDDRISKLTLPHGAQPTATCASLSPDENWQAVVAQWWQSEQRGCLQARTRKPEGTDDPCITPPEARYRGAENQLYRAEIHNPGQAWKRPEGYAGEPVDVSNNVATFKWSRDNGCVIFPIRSMAGDGVRLKVRLEHLGQDSRRSLAPGDWVEIVDDDNVLQGQLGPLYKVQAVNSLDLEVTLEGTELPDYEASRHPLLRRWDHKAGDPTLGAPYMATDGTLLLEEGKWLNLEDGVQVYFQAVSGNGGHTYRSGDYWLIPARTATGDVEWPRDDAGAPLARPPDGVEHHYAPLAIIQVTGSEITEVTPCRRKLMPLWEISQKVETVQPGPGAAAATTKRASRSGRKSGGN